MRKYLKLIKQKIHKIKAEAKKVGLSLPIALLILLTFSAIITIAIAQKQKQTYYSNAKPVEDVDQTPIYPTSTGNLSASPTKQTTAIPTKATSIKDLSTCNYGSYSDTPSGIKNCDNNCIVPCTTCRINSTRKWECPYSDPNEAKNAGIVSCGNYTTYNLATKCKTDEKCSSNCSSCTITDPYGGVYTKWFCAEKAGVSGGPTWNPNKLTPTITPKPTITPTIKAQNTIKPDLTTNPETVCTLDNQEFNVGQILCYNGFNYECTVTKNEAKPLKTTYRCGIDTTLTPIQQKNCKIGTNILSVGQTICYNGYWQTCVYNEHLQAVPYIKTPCGTPHSVIPTVDPTKAAAADPLYPTIQAIYAQKFVYPQTTYQQALTGLQTANTGQQIDCNVNTCVEK